VIRFLAVLMVFAVVPAQARAHAVGVEATLKADTVTVEAYFDDDMPAENASVVVVDAAGKQVATGKTDAKGVWSFPAPEPGRYTLRVDAGAGHLAKTILTIAEPSQSREGSVSDGASRSEFTGAPKWALAGLGVMAIAGVTVLASRWARRRPKEAA
jgi:hypothetical protein